MVNTSFDSNVRLLDSGDFSAVFASAQYKISCPEFLVLARSTDCKRARLGMVVAKKHVKLATQRNRIKRTIRESFRHQQDALPNVDIVVLVRKGAAAKDNKTLTLIQGRLWIKLANKARATVERPI